MAGKFFWLKIILGGDLKHFCLFVFQLRVLAGWVRTINGKFHYFFFETVPYLAAANWVSGWVGEVGGLVRLVGMKYLGLLLFRTQAHKCKVDNRTRV